MTLDRQTRAATRAETEVSEDLFSAPFGAHRPGALQRALIGLARGTILHRGKARHLMTRAITSLGGPLDITRNGCNYRIEGTNNLIEYGLLLHPGYNKPEIDFLCEGLGPNKVAVDIGSNVGLYTLALARTGARTVAVDANPAMVARLAFNAGASALSNVDIVGAAVGDGGGMASLEVHKNDVAIVNIVQDQEGSVPIRTLSEILASLEITRVDVLKIDIEGHEDAALAPFLATVPEDMIPDRIVIERVGPEDYPGCHREFTRLGFEAVGRTKSNSMYLRRG